MSPPPCLPDRRPGGREGGEKRDRLGIERGEREGKEEEKRKVEERKREGRREIGKRWREGKEEKEGKRCDESTVKREEEEEMRIGRVRKAWRYG